MTTHNRSAESNPDVPASPLHLLDHGLAAHRDGELAVANERYRQIPASSPFYADACYYRAFIHFQLQNLPAAIALFDEALALRPEQPAWLNDHGIAAASLGEHGDAAVFLQRAVDLAPQFALAHCNLAKSLRALGQLGDALRHFDAALKLDASLVDAALNLGGLFEVINRPLDAVESYRHAAAAAPDHPLPQMLLGTVLNHVQRYREVAACFERAATLAPDSADAHFGFGYAYDGQRDFDNAIASYRAALALQPDAPALHNNLAYSLTCVARYDEAKAHYQRAIELAPSLSEAHHQLAMIALRDGAFREGWRGFEHRRTTQRGAHDHGTLESAEWRGEALNGRRVLLTHDQGAGDQIQFVRYAALLDARGAKVDVWTSPELAALFSRAAGVSNVLTVAPAVPCAYDYWCPMMSVPGRLDDDTIPADVPYLSADVNAAAAWRERLAPLADARRKIGLVWAGNPRHHLDAFRSVQLAELLPLADAPNAEWFALQKGAAAQQRDDLHERWTIHPLEAELRDFDATAAAIDALDLVITVDTSVAHLAGALGKPVWVLLPAQSDWRWMHARDDSPWYPTARLFRQTTPGDWSAVVADVRAALAS